MIQPLVLSLFPGIGLLDMAFEEEGFCVVRGPDVLWGGDVRRFHPPAGKFDGVIGGPPCQAFSRLRHLVEHNGYEVAENLIPEFERCVYKANPKWFVMENVPLAPTPSVPGFTAHSVLINNRDFGAVQNRERRFSFGTRSGARLDKYLAEAALAVQMPSSYEPAVCASGGASPVPVRLGGSGKEKRTYTERHTATRNGASAMGFKTTAYLADAIRLQGLPAGFLDDAPFTVAGKVKVVGNGVPLPMGGAIAQAVKRAMYPELCEATA